MGCTLGTGRKTVENPESGADNDDAEVKTQTEDGVKGAVGAGVGVLSDVTENEVNERLYEKRDVTPKPNGNITKTTENNVKANHDNSEEGLPGDHGCAKDNVVTTDCRETKIQVVHEKLKTEEIIRPQEGGVDPAVHGAQMEDRFYNNKSFQKPDIDSNNPEQQEAALKIQTKYRQHHAKQVVQTKREEHAAVTIQAGYRGFQDRKKVKSIKSGSSKSETPAQAAEEEEIDIDLNDPEVAAAATKIQAGFRGHKARVEVKDLKEGEAATEQAPAEPQGEEEIDIDLTDPEVAQAATKIQAGFRGYQTRKDMDAKKDDGGETSAEAPKEGEGEQNAEEEEIDIDLNDPEVAAAATKIQAGFKGYKARKDVKGQQASTGDEAAPESTEEVPQQQEKQEDSESAPPAAGEGADGAAAE